ncbi:response regulator [Camelimonas abortus]|uniref:Response regulator n=1 Tax=Camelimonas abortus TaxID=1017184 RepID=A0ABV7LBS3_9HYPH
MSLSQEIAPHLPYLRRFARALTGSQKVGDAYVVAALEAIVADPSMVTPGPRLRLSLYRIFLRIWSSVGPGLETPESDAPGAVAEQRIAALTPLPRQAFLLTAIEGFSHEETGAILGVSAADAATLVNEAGREIAAQVAADVLIIEDEPIIAMDLEELVEDMGHRVIGVARTHREAVEKARQRRPGLVLADIQLADGSSGLDAVNEIIAGISAPVVFITAYPERLLTGERPEPAFLITKPFHTDTVRAAVSQALFFDQRAGGQRPAA